MVKLFYGKQGQVKFNTLMEYYYTLGFLADGKRAELRWENNENQGAWGSEGRIHCMVDPRMFPPFFKFQKNTFCLFHLPKNSKYKFVSNYNSFANLFFALKIPLQFFL